MASEVHTLVRRLAGSLTSGDMVGMARLHRFPCPFHAYGRTKVYADPAALMRGVALWREERWRKGTRQIEGRITALDLPRSQRLRVWVHWTHAMADGSVREVGTDLLFLTRIEGPWLIEMVDFLTLPAPLDGAAGADMGYAVAAAG